eukprot:3630228-Amphidinium_carterae.1
MLDTAHGAEIDPPAKPRSKPQPIQSGPKSSEALKTNEKAGWDKLIARFAWATRLPDDELTGVAGR